jgi:hypothetical protein
MLTACGAVFALFLVAWFLADRVADAEHVRIDNRVD